MQTREHFVWVGVNQIICRGLVAIKFLFIATLLGPEAIGLAGIGLLTLAIIESLTDTGLPQAIIQAPESPARKALSAIWLIQAMRGLAISLLLLALAHPIEAYFNINSAAIIIMFAALCPVLRNALSINYYLQQRNRNFRFIALTEMSCLAFDLAATLFFYSRNQGALSLIYGNIAADCLRLIISWSQPYFLSYPDWESAKGLKKFGKWIWINSIIIMIINQFDKLIIAKMLGASSFGTYQMAGKAGQMPFVDIATAFAQYLFPTLSRLHSVSPISAYYEFKNKLFILMSFFVFTSLSIFILIEKNMLYFVPENWITVLPIVSLLLPVMVMAAVNGILSAYLRAVGKPKIITLATLIQGCIAIPLVLYLCGKYGINGVIFGNTIAMFFSTFLMSATIYKLKESYLDHD